MMIACGSMRCRVTGWKMLICLRVNGDLVENAELSKVNQPQIPQAYSCNLLENVAILLGEAGMRIHSQTQTATSWAKTQTSLYWSNMF